MNQMIDFDKLVDIRQANSRSSRYQLRRKGEGKFFINNYGKSVIGHTPEMGVNLKAGAGMIVMGCLPKDDARCTRGLLNGSLGSIFTSSKLEDAIVAQKLEADAFVFEFAAEYQGIKYFKLVPVVIEEGEEDEAEHSAEVQANVTDISPNGPAPVAKPVQVVEPINEEF
jgi:hypothetical protein